MAGTAEYAYLAWENLPADTLEQLLGVRFEPADLVADQVGEQLAELPGS